MSLIDRSPGGFIFVANAVLYFTVLMETWMLVTGSALFMVGVMALIITTAGLLCRFILQLMGSEAYTLGEEPEAAVAGPSQAELVVAAATGERAVPVTARTPVAHPVA